MGAESLSLQTHGLPFIFMTEPIQRTNKLLTAMADCRTRYLVRVENSDRS